jgi:hypothetical protein
VLNVRQTLIVEVRTAEFNNRDNSDSEISNMWVRFATVAEYGAVKCSRWALDGRTRVTRAVVLQIAN